MQVEIKEWIFLENMILDNRNDTASQVILEGLLI